MTVTTIPRVAASSGPWRPRPWRAVVLAVVLAAAAGVAFQAWLIATHPAASGSAFAVLGEDLAACQDALGTECWVIPFVEGSSVGVGTTIRNDGPIPMTLLAIDSLGDPSASLATLDPEIVDAGSGAVVWGVGRGRPFEPITLEPGDEVAIQLVGALSDCVTAARSWPPGSGQNFSTLTMRVRWLALEQTIAVSLPSAVSLEAPRLGAC